MKTLEQTERALRVVRHELNKWIQETETKRLRYQKSKFQRATNYYTGFGDALKIVEARMKSLELLANKPTKVVPTF